MRLHLAAILGGAIIIGVGFGMFSATVTGLVVLAGSLIATWGIDKLRYDFDAFYLEAFMDGTRSQRDVDAEIAERRRQGTL